MAPPNLDALAKRLDELEAKSAAKDAEIAALKAQIAAGGKIEPADPVRARLAKQRAELMAKTKKTATGALYRVSGEGAYRHGRLYTEGEIIEIPVDEEPHHSWGHVAGDASPTPEAPPPPSAVRASDKPVA